MDPLTQKYIEVLNEKTDSAVVKTTLKTGHSFEGTEKLNKAAESDENVSKDLETPEEDKRNSSDEKDGAMEKAPKCEASNPFEELYNKILQEDAFGWEIENNTQDDLSNMDDEIPSLEDGEGDMEEDSDEEEADEVTLTLDKETAQKLVDMLQTAIGGESEENEENEESEEEEEEDFDFGTSDEEDGEDEETVKEEVDAEVVGHALVDQEKLLKGMNKPSNNVVKSTIKAHKKKAQVPTTGKGFKGQLTKQSDSAGKTLQNKNNKVSAVNVGKGVIDNK